MPLPRPEYAAIARLLVNEDEEDPISHCGQSVLYLLRTHARTLSAVPTSSASSTAVVAACDAFTTLLHLARQRITQTPFHAVSAPWLRLFVDATLGLVLSFVYASGVAAGTHEDRTSSTLRHTPSWTHWIGLLDKAIIVAGAVGEGREEAVHALIGLVQQDFAPTEWKDSVRQLQEIEEAFLERDTPGIGEGRGRKRPRLAYGAMVSQAKLQYQPRFAPRPIPTFDADSAPSISAYLRSPDLLEHPFVIKGYASASPRASSTSASLPCPAINRWRSASHLLQLTGPGRLVPVEVGASYTSPEWGQRVVPWETFLHAVGYEMNGVPSVHGPRADISTLDDSQTATAATDDDASSNECDTIHPGEPTYLAQHPLLTHFPALSADLGPALSPEYIHAAPPPPPGFPAYVPPGCEEGVVRNVWVGSGGARRGGGEDGDGGEEPVGPVVSPAHTDPYYNCYLQVTGRKRVWVAPPSVDPAHMYAFSDGTAPHDSQQKEDGGEDVGYVDAGLEGALEQGGSRPLGALSPARTASADSELDEESGLLTSYMTNTSRVPIFTPTATHTSSNNVQHTAKTATMIAAAAAIRAQFPAFYRYAWPQSMEIVLEPGDLMVMPPKWWHAMRSEGEDVVWSVSMWY